MKPSQAKPSNVFDLGSETANMYGFEPCPKCKSRFRCSFNNKPGIIQCDDCGYDEPGIFPEED